MTGPDIALTGIPRSGTTLCCHLLGRCTATVALFEPMHVMRLPLEQERAVAAVDAFYAEVRLRIAETGTAPSKQVDGVVPDNPFSGSVADASRQLRATEGSIAVSIPPGRPYSLVVKHNAAFAALLPALANALPTFAVVRNPLAVLASWNSVDLPVRQGRVPAAERLDRGLAAMLDAIGDPLVRQVAVLDWFCERYAALSPGRVLRYEDIVATDGAVLYAATGCRPAQQTPLRSRNPVVSRGGPSPRVLHAALLDGSRAWARWYDPRELEAQCRAMGGDA